MLVLIKHCTYTCIYNSNNYNVSVNKALYIYYVYTTAIIIMLVLIKHCTYICIYNSNNYNVSANKALYIYMYIQQ